MKAEQVKQSGAVRLFVDDNGYADHKAAWVDEKGRIMTIKLPSSIQMGSSGLATTGGQRVDVYKLNEQEYTCSPAVAEPMQLRNADYPRSAANRILFTHSLTKAGMLGSQINAAVTLPFRDYYLPDGTINTELVEACEKNFMAGGVEVLGCEAKPEIKSVVVKPEGLSAWFDWAMHDNGSMNDEYQEMMENLGAVLIVDIGGSTTDLVTVKPVHDGDDVRALIDQSLSGTSKVGVLDAKQDIESRMINKMKQNGVEGLSGHSVSLPSYIIERAMTKGEASFAGKKWDFNNERILACQGVASRINSYILSTVKMPQNYFRIVVVGGGALVFREHLQKLLPNAVFSDEFANARGLLKFMIAGG